MQREIITWAFGFFTLPVIGLVIAGAFFILGSWFGWLPENYPWLNSSHAWAGGWLFIATAILAGILIYRLI